MAFDAPSTDHTVAPRAGTVRNRWLLTSAIVVAGLALSVTGRHFQGNARLVVENASGAPLPRVQFELLPGTLREEFVPKPNSLADGVAVVMDVAVGERREAELPRHGEFAAGILLERMAGAPEDYVIGYGPPGDITLRITDDRVSFAGSGFFGFDPLLMERGDAARVGPLDVRALPQETLWSGRDLTDESQLPSAEEISQAANATEYTLQSYITTIEELLPLYERRALRTEGCVDASGWYTSGDLRKFLCESGSETAHESVALYFVSGRCIGMHRRLERIDGTYSSRYERVRVRSSEEVVYFNGVADIDDPTLRTMASDALEQRTDAPT